MIFFHSKKKIKESNLDFNVNIHHLFSRTSLNHEEVNVLNTSALVFTQGQMSPLDLANSSNHIQTPRCHSPPGLLHPPEQWWPTKYLFILRNLYKQIRELQRVPKKHGKTRKENSWVQILHFCAKSSAPRGMRQIFWLKELKYFCQ